MTTYTYALCHTRALYMGDSLEMAEMLARRLAGTDAVFGDWEPRLDDSTRRLVWRTEAQAANDDGARAVAEIDRHPAAPPLDPWWLCWDARGPIRPA